MTVAIDTNILVEAKGTVTREAVRMAVGQLADYARFLEKPLRAVLLPELPRADLQQLLAGEGIEVIWPSDRGFLCTRASLLDPAS